MPSHKAQKPTAPPPDPLWIIAIGASAGGLEALSAFLGAVPKGLNASFIVAQHLAPKAKSMLVELLARKTNLEVAAAADGMGLRAGTVLIVPPDFDLTFSQERLKLTRAGEKTRPKPSIDTLFSSLARTFGKQAVAIVLSGTGTDGSHGIQEIRAAGGVSLAQDNVSAKYDGMPRAAADTGCVDFVLPPEQLAEQLPEILERHFRDPPRHAPLPNSEDDFREILAVLRQGKGTDFAQYKPSTVRRRLAKRMAGLGIPDEGAYLAHLRDHPDEKAALAREMLVSVTSFFRDRPAFDRLRAALGELIARKTPGEELRIWVAGCATGEEAYTLAFMALEGMQAAGRELRLKIFATDLDNDAILYARSGRYTPAEVGALPEGYLRRYFDIREDGFDIKKFVRDFVVFARQDLTQHPPFLKVDLISCRNLLIYFEPKLQEKVFDIFHYSLAPGGILFLGKSEVPPHGSTLFTPVDRIARVYQRAPVSGKVFIQTARPKGQGDPTGPAIEAAPLAYQPRDRRSAYLAQERDNAIRELLESFGIGGAIVDAEGAVVQILGECSSVLTLRPGEADLRLSMLLPAPAGAEAPLLLHKAMKEDRAVRGRPHRISTRAGKRQLVLEVRPLPPTGPVGGYATRKTFLVAFELRKGREKAPEKAEVGTLEASEAGARVLELEQEVAVAREHLQTLSEELGVANEELQASNEELSSTNEELQASNEELETTNEEMQSTNEELTTLNEELNTKSTELRLLNSSLENIQSSIGSPLIVIDAAQRVTRFNALAQKIFQISAADLGQSVTQVSCNHEIPDFERKIRDTIERGHVNEAVVHTHRVYYQMRILPCRDELGRIVGALLIFFDNTELLVTEAKLKSSEGRIRSIIDGSPALIALKDTLGRYLAVNRAFLDLFSLEESQVLGKTDREILPAGIANQFRDADLEVLLQRVPSEKQEELSLKAGARVLLSSRFPLFDAESGKNPYALGVVSLDVSRQVRVQQQLELSEARYKAMIEDQAVLVCRHEPSGRLTFANRAFPAYFGGSPDTYVDRSFYQFMGAAEAEADRALLEQLQPDRPIVHFEHPVSRAAGPGLAKGRKETRWLRWIHRGLFDAENTLVEIQSVGFDITELKVQAAELGEREKLFASILTFTSDFLLVYRVTGDLAGGREDYVLESVNQSAENALSLLGGGFAGKHLSEVTEAARYAETLARFKRCRATGRSVSFDEAIPLPSGPKHYSTTLVPVADPVTGQVDRIAALSKDISRHKQIEDELRQEKLKADAANQAKSDFLASMSHELRTPLNVILGMSELLGGSGLSAEQGRYAESIQRSGKILLSLIEDVLDLSKIEAGKIALESRAFSVPRLAEDVALAFELQAKAKNLRLVTEFDHRAPLLVLGDETRVRQVLVNFVANAIKFTGEGGVTIRLAEIESSNSLVARFRFEVRDTGVGIPQEAFERLFSRFSQADSGHTRKFGGTGLGLAISKQLVDLMNGLIGFESQEGKGSVFWFELQLPTARALPVAPAALRQGGPPAGGAGFRRLHVLAVDDNLESHALLRAFLKRLGHVPEVVAGATQALELLESRAAGPTPFDIVLMDVQMPGLDGMEATRRIRTRRDGLASIPVIALTANALKGQDQECHAAGMNDFLTKPVSFTSLKEVLEKWSPPSTGGAVPERMPGS